VSYPIFKVIGIDIANFSFYKSKEAKPVKEYIVFIHEPDTAMVSKVEVVRARSRRMALKILERMGFKKIRF
jgi:hypothetical protein